MTVDERFWSKVNKTESCWLWTGAKSDRGYGLFSVKNRHVRAHRYAYVAAGGVIPDKYEIDHMCRSKLCVNPAHLEAVTHRENVCRGLMPNRAHVHQLAKTHCPRGHEYSEENTRRNRGKRYCRACARLRKQQEQTDRRLMT